MPADAVVRPEWLSRIIDFVEDAAANGEPITVSAEQRFYTPAQAAAALNVSRSTISRKISQGLIKAEKVGTHHRISERELDRYWMSVMADMIDATRDELVADLFDD